MLPKRRLRAPQKAKIIMSQKNSLCTFCTTSDCIMNIELPSTTWIAMFALIIKSQLMN
jgi:hypothetical protein